MSWQLLLIICVVFFSVAVLLQRILLRNQKTDPIAYAILFEGISGILVLAAAFVNGIQMPDFSKYLLPITATVFLYALGGIIYAKTLKIVDASIFSVLFATNTVWVMLGGLVIFNETILVSQLFGAALILLSVALLADRTGKFKLDKGILMGLLSGLIYGFAITGWVYVGKHSEPLTWTGLSFLIPAGLIFLYSPKAKTKMAPLLKKDVLAKLGLLCLLMSFASICLLSAFSKHDASTISPLLQTEVFLTVLLATIFLHERENLRLKFLSATVCMLGVFLIVS